jgi:hypothetical protein
MTPTQRGLAYLRARGWLVTTATWWNPHARRRHDLWGWQDAQAFLSPGAALPGDQVAEVYYVVGVQFCRTADLAAHETKIRSLAAWRLWKLAGGLTLLLGWSLRPQEGKRGARKVWTVTERWL